MITIMRGERRRFFSLLVSLSMLRLLSAGIGLYARSALRSVSISRCMSAMRSFAARTSAHS